MHPLRLAEKTDLETSLLERAAFTQAFGFERRLGLSVGYAKGNIVANAGVLVTKVLYHKANPEKTFLIVDAAMNDLIRPAFYDSYHEIVPVMRNGTHPTISSDVVGPICESADVFARNRRLGAVVEATDTRPAVKTEIESLGFDFYTSGGVPYWTESAYYLFTAAEIDATIVTRIRSSYGVGPFRYRPWLPSMSP